MISRFDDDDVRTEVRSKHQTQRADHIRLFWLAARKTQLSKLLIRTKHDKLWSENDSATSNQQFHFYVHFQLTPVTANLRH